MNVSYRGLSAVSIINQRDAGSRTVRETGPPAEPACGLASPGGSSQEPAHHASRNHSQLYPIREHSA
ncbi:hypothetical protein OUY22_09285, partial [Nonomuraea sp. MCN248]